MKFTMDLIKEHKLFEFFWDNSNDGLNVVDINGNIVFVNKVSADYLNFTVEEMTGNPISDFYPKAVLLEVLRTRKAIVDRKIHHVAGKNYVVNSRPIYIDDVFVGAFSIFKDIQDIQELNRKIKHLELHLNINKSEEEVDAIIGREKSLQNIILQARRTVGSIGGPRHSIITGESGTGKTMLAQVIHSYATKVGVIDKNAPFIEVNCAQYTNPDLAAIEIFGSEKGAFTGSTQKIGLFEQASGGILFLDEAHALEHYQTMLLKVIESGKIRRIGGRKDIQVDVIIIAASTKNLKDELLPELYQRLAQYEMYLPALRERSIEEKEDLLNHFIKKYEAAVQKLHKIEYVISFSDMAKELLLKASYPRNIRQFRDIINFSIDAASPLISDIQNQKHITTWVTEEHLPFEISDPKKEVCYKLLSDTIDSKNNKITADIGKLIEKLNQKGLGPRKIANHLKEIGHSIEYYKVAYYLKKH